MGDDGGWMWFFMVFVVGNAVLYAATGIFIIPLPRCRP